MKEKCLRCKNLTELSKLFMNSNKESAILFIA